MSDCDAPIDLDAIEAYDYALPVELIAQFPAARREDARLMVAHRQDGRIEHRQFAEIGQYLRPHDLLVFNNTRVVPARLMARKPSGGRVEFLALDVVEPRGPERWSEPARGRLVLEGMTRASKPLRPATALELEGRPGAPMLEVLSCSPGQARVEVSWQDSATAFLEAFGEIPLPPYIVSQRQASGRPEGRASAEDRERYQTVYAERPGAVAAPTAGLHFSSQLLASFEERGISQAFVTLTVGAGTFKPVACDRLSAHVMHAEEYAIGEDFAERVTKTREAGGRIIAVGTTTARTLEAEARRENPFAPGVRHTEIFLRPGNGPRLIDGLVTNFHLPRSTLMALVASFAGHALMRQMYAEAVAERYRFYSYGDSSLLL